MTVSVKAPTSTTGSIQLNGSDVLTIESDRSVDIDSGTLHVDATNNRVGIGTSSPNSPLHIFSSNTPVVNIEATGSGPNTGLLVTKQQGSGDLADWNAITINGNDNISYESRIQWQFDSLANGPVIGGKRTGSGETHLTFHTNSGETLYERMRIDGSTGSVRIGSNNAYGLNEKLMVYGSSTANQPTIISSKEASGTVGSNHFLFQNTNGTVGSIVTSGSTTSYNTSSDYRLKENVAPMSGSIDRLKQLKPSTWTWIQNGSHGEGFVAHEAQAVVPEAVTGTKDAMRTEEYEVTPAVLDDDGNVVTEAVMGTREVPDYQGIDQSKLVPLLTAALQEAITKIEDLETRIQALESA